MLQADEAGNAAGSAVNREHDHLHLHDVCGCLESPSVHQPYASCCALMPQAAEACSAPCAAINREHDDHLHIHDVCGPLG
jgi:hypothetical protein